VARHPAPHSAAERRPLLEVHRGKFREVEVDKLKQWHEIGLLPLIYSHLFSLDLMRVIFAKQTQQGKGPGAANGAAT